MQEGIRRTAKLLLFHRLCVEFVCEGIDIDDNCDDNIVRDWVEYTVANVRGVAQLGLACLTGGQEVEGSNPSAPT